jgi:hypothetical protein
MKLFRRKPDKNHESSPSEFARQSEALIPAHVCMISGCHSEQTSADLRNAAALAELPNPAGRSGGACTSALLEILYRNRNKPITFQQVLLDLRKSLQNAGLDQIPQLTSSRPLDVQDTPFTLVGNPSGVRRAVLVGINYRGQSGELSGCHNDIFNVKQYIMNVHGYREQNILILVDDGRHHYPNRANIVNALLNVVASSQSGDSVYFHYSGHGGLLNADWNVFKTNNKDYDETLYPLDHSRSGHIRDFSLFKHFVQPMRAGVTVTCVIDACHSGAVLELPYSYQPTDGGTIRMQRNMTSLSNLAFLYVLAGGVLPHGFGNVAENIQNVTGCNLEEFQGMGMEEADDAQDIGGYDDVQDDGDVSGYGDDMPAYGDVGDGPDFDGGVPEHPAQGYDVTDDGTRGFSSDYESGGYDVTGNEYDSNNPGGDWGDPAGDSGGWSEAVDGGETPDVDCTCLGDVLGALLEGD